MWEISEAGGLRESVFLQKSDGAAPIRLGDGKPTELSPDGRFALAAQSRRELVMLPTGIGQEKRIAAGAFEGVSDARWLPDGRRILALANVPGGRLALYLIDIEGGAPQMLGPEGLDDQARIAVSPDGRRVAAVGAGGDVLLVPLAGGAPGTDAAFRKGDLPICWSAGSDALYVFRKESPTATVEKIDLRTHRREAFRTLAAHETAGVPVLDSVVMRPDAKGYAYAYQQILSDLYIVEGLK
jgi:dipeptidyl aminopeptidase/acylaminoacyl peptidase